MTNEVFNSDKIEKIMLELKDMPPFKPDKYEMRFSATQLFSTGNDAAVHKEVTLWFVFRDGEVMFYDFKEKFVNP